MTLRDLSNIAWNSVTPKSRFNVRKARIQLDEKKTQKKINQFFPSRKRTSDQVHPVEDVKRRKEASLFDHDDVDIPANVRSLHRIQSMCSLQTSVGSMENSFDSCDAQEGDVRTLQRIQSMSILQTSTVAMEISFSSPKLLEHYSLKLVEKPQIVHKAFQSISGETLCQLMTSMSEEQFLQKFILIDCRYPFEYNGGHIKGSINLHDTAKLQDVFFPVNRSKFEAVRSRIPIFYCEFSQKRGPNMAGELRRTDRKRNLYNYPNIDYNEIYVVDRGYRKFFVDDNFVNFCEPKAYVPMLHPDHLEELKRYSMHRKNFKRSY
uniref:protein-tyrosine-phosphatase n=1 Tax=Ditylenchus dipsaci TaxID=166011 RepID=A0A915EKE0_9BILA